MTGRWRESEEEKKRRKREIEGKREIYRLQGDRTKRRNEPKEPKWSWIEASNLPVLTYNISYWESAEWVSTWCGCKWVRAHIKYYTHRWAREWETLYSVYMLYERASKHAQKHSRTNVRFHSDLKSPTESFTFCITTMGIVAYIQREYIHIQYGCELARAPFDARTRVYIHRIDISTYALFLLIWLWSELLSFNDSTINIVRAL